MNCVCGFPSGHHESFMRTQKWTSLSLTWIATTTNLCTLCQGQWWEVSPNSAVLLERESWEPVPFPAVDSPLFFLMGLSWCPCIRLISRHPSRPNLAFTSSVPTESDSPLCLILHMYNSNHMHDGRMHAHTISWFLCIDTCVSQTLISWTSTGEGCFRFEGQVPLMKSSWEPIV